MTEIRKRGRKPAPPEEQQARKERKYAYHRSSFKMKNVVFSLLNEQDQKLMKFAETKPNFSNYVKDLIRKDMGSSEA